jgi:hypothetical protein
VRCAKQINVVVQANDRAAAAGRKAFVSVLGLGLGVWKLIPAQARIFLQVGLISLMHPSVLTRQFMFKAVSSVSMHLDN